MFQVTGAQTNVEKLQSGGKAANDEGLSVRKTGRTRGKINGFLCHNSKKNLRISRLDFKNVCNMTGLLANCITKRLNSNFFSEYFLNTRREILGSDEFSLRESRMVY